MSAAGFIVGFDEEQKTIAPLMSTCIRETAIPTAHHRPADRPAQHATVAAPSPRRGRLLEGFRKTMTESGDMCTAGLNFVTKRPRREIMKDYRDVVAEAYSPEAFFGRVRVLGKKLRPAYFRKQKIHWPNIARDLAAFARLSWAMSFTFPELARPYWATLYAVLRQNPIAIEGVVRNIAHYMHLYPFSRYVLRTVDGRIAEIDAGGWPRHRPSGGARDRAGGGGGLIGLRASGADPRMTRHRRGREPSSAPSSRWRRLGHQGREAREKAGENPPSRNRRAAPTPRAVPTARDGRARRRAARSGW